MAYILDADVFIRFMTPYEMLRLERARFVLDHSGGRT